MPCEAAGAVKKTSATYLVVAVQPCPAPRSNRKAKRQQPNKHRHVGSMTAAAAQQFNNIVTQTLQYKL
jgi:hypothetical protein